MHGIKPGSRCRTKTRRPLQCFAHHGRRCAAGIVRTHGVWARLIAGSATGLSNGRCEPSRRCSICNASLNRGAPCCALPVDHTLNALLMWCSVPSRMTACAFGPGSARVSAGGGEPVCQRRRMGRPRLMLLGCANIGPRFISSGGTWCPREQERIEHAKAELEVRLWLCLQTTTGFIPLPDFTPMNVRIRVIPTDRDYISRGVVSLGLDSRTGTGVLLPPWPSPACSGDLRPRRRHCAASDARTILARRRAGIVAIPTRYW